MKSAFAWVARGLTAVLLGIALLTLGACAAGPTVVDHAFSFDTRYDAQDAEVLDYRYGASRQPVQAPASAVRDGTPLYQTNVHGPMLRGESLYVKWRDQSTGQVYEDTVDLTRRLPADLTGKRIHFTIKGKQLYVFLISPRPSQSSQPPNGPRMYRDLETTLIYPDQP